MRDDASGSLGTSSPPLPRTLVVGGGIGGLTAAAALSRLGAEVRVCEQAPSFSPVGAGITIQANATAVLQALGIGLPEDDTVPIGSVEVVDRHGRALIRGNPEHILPDPPSVNFHRADLHRTLLAACDGVPLATSRRVARVETGDDSVEVEFDDGSRETCELLIGADGIDSSVRRSIAPESMALRYSGQTCWRFALEAPGNVPEVSVERWSPGRRAGVIPLARGRVYVYLVENAPRGTPGPGSSTPERVRERFGGIDRALDAILSRLDDRVAIHHDDLCDREAVSYGSGRVLLIGDAAHAMTPNLGQGAGTAIEDAAALYVLLAEGQTSLAGLVPAMDALRRERVTSVLRGAWRIGQVAHWRHPVARFVRDGMLRMLPPRASDAQARRLWAPGLELAERVARCRADFGGA